MKRHRVVAAAPVRSPGAAWRTITDLVVMTLERSASLSVAEAAEGMSAARPAGLALIAGGHLDSHPITLVAGPLYCTIGTVSGTRAFEIEENLDPVPGAATATGFTVHLPAPEPHRDLVRGVAKAHHRLSAAEPPAAAQEVAGKSVGIIDLAALERLGTSDD